MANIRISAIDIAVDKKILEAYEDYISTADESVRQDKQRFLETAMASLYNAKRITGNPPLIPDYYVEPDSLIEGIAPFFEKERSGTLNIEAKFQRKGEGSKTSTTIGGRVSTEVTPQIQKKLKAFDPGEDLYTYITKQLKISSGSALFNFLAVNAPKFHNEAYQKAKNLTIFTKTSGSVLAYQIYFPKSKFISGIFGANLTADQATRSYTFSYFLNNSFEKSLILSVQASLFKTSLEEFRNLSYAKASKTKIKFGLGGKSTQTVNIYWPQTNSIPVANIRTRLPDVKIVDDTSLLNITMRVRGRTRLRMRRGDGNPKPPKIYNRSGTFKDSIEVAAISNNTKIIDYFYKPYYDSLEKYGYQIQDLVEGSIRAIAQERLGKQFILRKVDSRIY
jgi:hypothetical protein